VELADVVIEATQGRRASAPRPPMNGAITHDPLRAFSEVSYSRGFTLRHATIRL
jgi:hypothetical protein